MEELGFEYDSSIFPVYHDNYSIPDAPRFFHTLSGSKLTEYPISTVLVIGWKVPISGGGYLRFFPYGFTRHGLRSTDGDKSRDYYCKRLLGKK